MIVKENVKFPDNITGHFRDFLEGLLNKDPTERLSWPNLLNHPFVKETASEKVERTNRGRKYNQWTELEHLPKE